MAIVTAKGSPNINSSKEVDKEKKDPTSTDSQDNIIQFNKSEVEEKETITPGLALRTILNSPSLRNLVFSPSTIDNVNQSKGQLALAFPVNEKYVCNTITGNTQNSKNKANLIKLEFHGCNVANKSFMKINGEVYKQDIQKLAEWFNEQESYLLDSGTLKSLIMINHLYIRDMTMLSDNKERLTKQVNYVAKQFVNALHGFDDLEEIWIEILDAYFESHRKYHTFEHIYKALLMLHDYQHDHETPHLSLAESDARLVKLAIIFHDFIYKVGATDNEEKTVEKVEKLLKSIRYSERNIELIKTLILSTKPLQAKDSEASNMNKLISDIDLAGFGLPWQKFLAENKKIAQEFMPDGPTIQGIEKQMKFLEALSNLGIYRTEYFIELYEHIAQANIKKEIDRLIKQKQEIIEDEQRQSEQEQEQ